VNIVDTTQKRRGHSAVNNFNLSRVQKFFHAILSTDLSCDTLFIDSFIIC